jgi:hypothetical protein
MDESGGCTPGLTDEPPLDSHHRHVGAVTGFAEEGRQARCLFQGVGGYGHPFGHLHEHVGPGDVLGM